MDAVRAESIRTLYVQARNSTAAAAVVTVYMVATTWPYTAPRRHRGMGFAPSC